MREELTTDCSFPWPSEGDVLLKEADLSTDVSVSLTARSWELQATAFEELARLGMEHLKAHKDYPALPQFLFSAIAYNYRHAVELRLKSVIEIGNRICNESEPIEPQKHNLKGLWRSVRKLEERYLSRDSALLDTFEKLLNQLADVDPSSTAFRYHDSRGMPTLCLPVSELDVPNFANRMEALLNYLRAMASEMIAYEDERGYWSELPCWSE